MEIESSMHSVFGIGSKRIKTRLDPFISVLSCFISKQVRNFQEKIVYYLPDFFSGFNLNHTYFFIWPYEMLHSAACHLGLYCIPLSILGITTHKWENEIYSSTKFS